MKSRFLPFSLIATALVGGVPAIQNSLARLAVDKHNKKDEHGSGWREVPGDDPEVQHVAEHAVKILNRMCNTKIPYVLHEVLHANAEVTGHEAAKFNMILKGKRGENEDKYKVEVHKNHEGALRLNLFTLRNNMTTPLLNDCLLK